MALTLVTRELFSGYGTLNTASPGNLGTVWDTLRFQKRPVGPNVSGMSTDPNYGWSALLEGAGQQHAHYRLLTSPEQTCGVFSRWYNLSHVVGVDGGPILGVMRYGGSYTGFSSIKIAENGQLGLYSPQGVVGTDVAAFPVVPLHAWWALVCAWENDSTYTRANWYWVCPDAGVAPLTLISSQEHDLLGLSPNRVDGGSIAVVGSAAQNAVTGRYALPTWYSAAAIEDAEDIDISAELPTKRRTVYRVRPGDPAADDDSDGIQAAGRCWETMARVRTAFKTGELMGSALKFLDTAAGGPFDTSENTQQAAVDFANGVDAGTIVVDPNNGSTVNFDSDLEHIFDDRSSWYITLGRIFQHGILWNSSIDVGLQKGVKPSVQLSGTWTRPEAVSYPNIWTISLPESFTACGMWEILQDGTVLATQQIASASWDTAAKTAVNAVAGRFWFTGSTLYYHPLSGANPNTDNRTRRVTNNETDADYVFDVYETICQNLKTTETGAGVWNGASSSVYALGGYGFARNYQFSAIRNCVAERYGKHAMGDFGEGNGAWIDIVTRGAILTSINSLTAHVIYRKNSEAEGTVVVRNWTESGRYEILGQSTFETTNEALWESMLMHNDGGAATLETVVYDNCTFLGKIKDLSDMPSQNTILINTDLDNVDAPRVVNLGEYVRANDVTVDTAAIAAATLAAINADATQTTARTSAATAATQATAAAAAAAAAGLDAKKARQFQTNRRTREVLTTRQHRYTVYDDDSLTVAYRVDFDPVTGNLSAVA